MTRATTEDVIELYSALRAERVRLWVDGGWGIDALLGRQTRLHKDFDAVAAFEDLPALTRLLDSCGFALKLIWEENRWAPSSELLVLIGRERPAVAASTAFVLEDGLGRELDFHIVVRLDEHGQWVPAWDSDLAFPPKRSPAWGRSAVGGRCLSAQMQMRTHTGYALKESDIHDLRLLHDRFGIEYPEEVADLFSAP